MKALCLAVLFLLLAAGASADILRWEDNKGVVHYTNLEAAVPVEYRARASKVVDESVRRRRAPEEDDRQAEAVPDREKPRMAQVVYDRPPQSDDYVEGLRTGLRMAHAAPQPPQTVVRIEGPLAVASASASTPRPPGYHTPWLQRPLPLVTTSFDRGRSRHLTLRMLVQDALLAAREETHRYDSRYRLHTEPAPRSIDIDRRILRQWKQQEAEPTAEAEVLR